MDQQQYQNQGNPQQQNFSQPQNFTQPPMNQPMFDPTQQVMSVGQWLGMLILNMIPIVNFICWIVWLASGSTNKNKKNFIKASIALWAIGVVIVIFFSILTTMGIIASDPTMF